MSLLEGQPRGIAQVHPDAPAAVLMVDLDTRSVLYANTTAAQMAPGLALPVGIDEWSATADLRDLHGDPLDETGHPLSRLARYEPVAGQGVSAARASDLGEGRDPLWVVALPLDDAPNLRGHALVVFLPVRDREELQERAEAAHERSSAVREAAVLATGLSFTVADAFDPEMPLVWVNPAFTAVTGYSFDSAVGRNCRFLQGPGTDRAVTARMRAALDGGESCTEVVLNYRADGTAFWNQVAMSPILDVLGRVSHYVGIQTDVSGRVVADAERDRALAAERAARAEAEDAHARLELLAEATRRLSEVVDPEQALNHLSRLVVPVLGDFAVLAFVRDDTTVPTRHDSGGSAAPPAGAPTGPSAGPSAGPPTGPSGGARTGAPRHGLHDVAWWHHDPQLLPTLADHARTRLHSLSPAGRASLAALLGPDGQVVVGDASDDADLGGGPHRCGDSQAVTARLAGLFEPGRAREALLELAPSSMATFALRSRGRTLGMLTVGRSAGRARLDADDLALGTDVAVRAGLALDRSRLFRQQRDLAETLQLSLLGLSATSAPPHLEVAVRYVAAAEAARVGGDFYDLFTQPGGAAVAVIGDVMGHDTQAAAAMAQLRSTVRTLGVVGDDGPARMLTRTDEVARALGVDTTATVAVVRLSPPLDDDDAGPGSRPMVLEWSNAGHPPLLVLLADGSVQTLEGPRTDLLLGVDPGTRRQQATRELPAGATLLLYTDGLVERRDQPLAEGIARLREVVERLARGPGGVGDLEALVDAVLAEMVPMEPSDDVAVLVLRGR